MTDRDWTEAPLPASVLTKTFLIVRHTWRIILDLLFPPRMIAAQPTALLPEAISSTHICSDPVLSAWHYTRAKITSAVVLRCSVSRGQFEIGRPGFVEIQIKCGLNRTVALSILNLLIRVPLGERGEIALREPSFILGETCDHTRRFWPCCGACWNLRSTFVLELAKQASKESKSYAVCFQGEVLSKFACSIQDIELIMSGIVPFHRASCVWGETWMQD